MTKHLLALLLCIGCTISCIAQKPLEISKQIRPVEEQNIFKTEGYYNWGGSIIKGLDGNYHLFYSRWPKPSKFSGWLLFSEIAHAVSKTPSGPWEYKETVLTGRGEGHWDAITAHNPKINYFEGKYYLYYISTNLGQRSGYTTNSLMQISQTGNSHPDWNVLRPNQRTGVAVAHSLAGPWTRQDQPLLQPSGPITTLTVNPAIDKGKDGRYYLIVKGDKPNEKQFIRNQAIAISDHPDRDFVIQPDPVIDYLDTEDMSLWYDKENETYYGIFHTTAGFIGMVCSSDGLRWKKAPEYKIMTKEIRLADGQLLKPDRLERPFVYLEDGKPQTLLLSAKDGDDSFIVFIPLEK